MTSHDTQWHHDNFEFHIDAVCNINEHFAGMFYSCFIKVGSCQFWLTQVVHFTESSYCTKSQKCRINRLKKINNPKGF